MKIRNLICAVLLLSSAFLMAADKDYDAYRHSFRIGWGTAFSSRMTDDLRARNVVPQYNRDYIQVIQGMTAQEAHEYLTYYRMMKSGTRETTSSGAIFAAYAYRITPLISVGVEVEGIFLSDRFHMMDGYGVSLKEPVINKLYHLTLMPTVRFTYYNQRVLELYSALGLGYNCGFYTSTIESTLVLFECPPDNPPIHGLSANATLFGVNVGNEHWYAEAEIGLKGTWLFANPDFANSPFSSRLLSVAVGYRF